MNSSANRSSSAVVNPGRTSRISISIVLATIRAAARMASISLRSLTYTMASPRRRVASQRADQPAIHFVHRPIGRHLGQPAARAVVLHERRGLLAVDLEPPAHGLLRVVRALHQLHPGMVVAVAPVPRRRTLQIVEPLAHRALP